MDIVMMDELQFTGTLWTVTDAHKLRKTLILAHEELVFLQKHEKIHRGMF